MLIQTLLVLVFQLPSHLLALPQGVPLGPAVSSTDAKCDNITVPMCRGIGYNLTSMPNQFNHYTQEEAGLEVHQFLPLVDIHCSPYLRFFLCSMYAPICMPKYRKPVPACREVCEIAREGCLPVMDKYGFAWPDLMDCKNFPRSGDKKNLCMDESVAQMASHDSKPYRTSQHSLATASGAIGPIGSPESIKQTIRVTTTHRAADCDCSCRAPLVLITNTSSRHYNKVRTGGQLNCAVPCEGLFFTEPHEKTFARFWIGLWSCLCICSTLLTCLTFLVDTNRFMYPERPIIYLSFCLLLVSIGYTIPIFAGHENVACEPAQDPSGARLLVRDSSGSPLCTLTFVLVYFFGISASSWWVILALTWFLSAGLKWGQEVIARYAPYFHVIAWGIPAAQTGAALALSAVDGDSLAGYCYVGNLNPHYARFFLLLPLSIHVLLGAAFLVTGFIALFRVRNSLRRQGLTKTGRLEKLMIRIGVFSVLYTVPVVIVVLCHFYEQHFRPTWEWSHACKGDSCPAPTTPLFPSASQGLDEPLHGLGGASTTKGAMPDFSAFMLKYFMSVVVGITSGFWMWSGKTVESWKACYRRVCCSQCCRPIDKQPVTLPVGPPRMNDPMLAYQQQQQQQFYLQQQQQQHLLMQQQQQQLIDQVSSTAIYSQVTRPNSGGRMAEPGTARPVVKRSAAPVDRTSSWGGSSLLGCGGSSGEASASGGRVNNACTNTASFGD